MVSKCQEKLDPEFVKRFDRKMAKAPFCKKVRDKITQEIARDRVLPLLSVNRSTAISIEQSEDEILIVVGPRDWQFTPDGEFLGSGTMFAISKKSYRI